MMIGLVLKVGFGRMCGLMMMPTMLINGVGFCLYFTRVAFLTVLHLLLLLLLAPKHQNYSSANQPTALLSINLLTTTPKGSPTSSSLPPLPRHQSSERD